MQAPIVAVFGGTGFLGRQIVLALADSGCRARVAARHPEKSDFARGDVERIPADVRDEAAVDRAVEGAGAVVNAVSLYRETREASFADVHVVGARRIAEAARRHRVPRLVQLSGIGSDASSSSPYIRARGQGEAAVREAFPAATLFRPSAMFGPDDSLISALLDVVRMPVVPLFGRGRTRLQPVFVGDVAEAAARVLTAKDGPAPVYEFGGPRIYTYRELVETVLRASGRRRPLVPVPFAAWDALAAGARILPSPPITEGQVALMKKDNVAKPGLPGLDDLRIAARPLEAELDRRIARA